LREQYESLTMVYTTGKLQRFKPKPHGIQWRISVLKRKRSLSKALTTSSTFDSNW